MSKAETSIPNDLKLWPQGKHTARRLGEHLTLPAPHSLLPTGKTLTKGRAQKKLHSPQPQTTFYPHTLERWPHAPSLWWAGKPSYECQQFNPTFAMCQDPSWALRDARLTRLHFLPSKFFQFDVCLDSERPEWQRASSPWVESGREKKSPPCRPHHNHSIAFSILLSLCRGINFFIHQAASPHLLCTRSFSRHQEDGKQWHPDGAREGLAAYWRTQWKPAKAAQHDTLCKNTHLVPWNCGRPSGSGDIYRSKQDDTTGKEKWEWGKAFQTERNSTCKGPEMRVRWQGTLEAPRGLWLVHVRGGERGTRVPLLRGLTSCMLGCSVGIIVDLPGAILSSVSSTSIPSLARSPRSKNPVDSLFLSLPHLPSTLLVRLFSSLFPRFCEQ